MKSRLKKEEEIEFNKIRIKIFILTVINQSNLGPVSEINSNEIQENSSTEDMLLGIVLLG